MHYASLRNGTTVSEGSILSISSGEYISADGGNDKVDGVILPTGSTLTIEKGGILSIDSDFVNNGTIINNGGTILVKDGGTLAPYMQESDAAKNGCGSLKCLGGDIIIMKGGAVYAGLNDSSGSIVPFQLDKNSTLINQGLLVYGSLRLGEASRIELYGGSKTVGSVYEASYLRYSAPSSASTADELKKMGFVNVIDHGGTISYTLVFPLEQRYRLSTYNQNFLQGSTSTAQLQQTVYQSEVDDVNFGMYLSSGIRSGYEPHAFNASEYASLAEQLKELDQCLRSPEDHTPDEIKECIDKTLDAIENYSAQPSSELSGNKEHLEMVKNELNDKSRTLTRCTAAFQARKEDRRAGKQPRKLSRTNIRKSHWSWEKRSALTHHRSLMRSAVRSSVLGQPDCHPGTDIEMFFNEQKAKMAEFAAKTLAVRMIDLSIRDMQLSYSGSNDQETKGINAEMLGSENINNGAAEIQGRADFERMMQGVQTWDDLNALRSLTLNNNGSGLINELSRSSKSIINEENQAERMREAQKELEQRRHDDPVMGM